MDTELFMTTICDSTGRRIGFCLHDSQEAITKQGKNLARDFGPACTYKLWKCVEIKESK